LPVSFIFWDIDTLFAVLQFGLGKMKDTLKLILTASVYKPVLLPLISIIWGLSFAFHVG
jgi:hypothetical protein